MRPSAPISQTTATRSGACPPPARGAWMMGRARLPEGEGGRRDAPRRRPLVEVVRSHLANTTQYKRHATGY